MDRILARLAVTAVVGTVVGFPAGLSADWPQANGPTGNFNPRRYGHRLVDDLSEARREWVSEFRDLGYGKGSASGYVRILATYPGHPGSCSGPIVGDGKVFASSFRPAGTVWAEKLPHLRGESGQRWLREHGTRLRQNLRIEADDLTVAIDFKTGKTLWVAVESGRGVNRYMGKREGFGVGPAYHQGRVFSMGTTGRLYCYDAITGKKQWETDIGPAFRKMEELRRAALDRRTLADTFGWDASLVVADGVLVVPMFDHPVDMGLRGVDVATGRTLWELPAATSRYATPAVWQHRGHQYVLVATRSGRLRLIAPHDGRVLWTVDGLGPTWFALAPSDRYVLVNVGSKKPGSKNTPYGRLGAFRLSLEAAHLEWVMPDRKEFWFENHMDSCAKRKALIRDGRVYAITHNKEGGTRNKYFNVLREDDGEVLARDPDWLGGSSSQVYLIEDRLLDVVDACHSDRARLRLVDVGGPSIRPLCEPWSPPLPITTGYEVFLEFPYVDGRILLRSRRGDIHCLDLRAIRPVPRTPRRASRGTS